MAALIGNMGPFELNTEPWSSYTERFGYFVLANKIAPDLLVPTFLSVMGYKTFNVLRSLVQPAKPGDLSYEETVTILGDHYSPKLVIAERFRFHKRNQEEGESVSQFVAVLKRLSEHCDFGDALDDTLRDRLVFGLRSEAIQKRLLTEADLPLDRAIDISTSMEMAAGEEQKFRAFTPKNETATGKPCSRCGNPGQKASECNCLQLATPCDSSRRDGLRRSKNRAVHTIDIMSMVHTAALDCDESHQVFDEPQALLDLEGEQCIFCPPDVKASSGHLIQKHLREAVYFVDEDKEKFVVACHCPEGNQTKRSHNHCPWCEHRAFSRSAIFMKHLKDTHGLAAYKKKGTFILHCSELIYKPFDGGN